MSSSDKFFGTKKAAAVLKHGLLKRYLPVFVSKLGSTAPGRQVGYIDGFAGPGTYEDGSPGSPLLAVQMAKEIKNRTVIGHYIEKNAQDFDNLKTALAPYSNAKPYHGNCATIIPELLPAFTDLPLLVFLDPWGRMPFDLVAGVLRRRTRRATEVLLNFNLSGLRRARGRLGEKPTSDTVRKNRASALARIDSSLGGDWWRKIALAGARDWIDQVLARYVEELSNQCGGGWGGLSVAVAKNWRSKPIYHIVLVTRSYDGYWAFMQASSSALEEQAKVIDEGQVLLIDHDSEMVNAIQQNIEDGLSIRTEINTPDDVYVIFGRTLGFARDMHLRKAIKRLHKGGIVDHNGVGKLNRITIRPYTG